MKINGNSKNFVSKIVIVLLTIITLNYTNVFATNELKPGEKSAEYKKWENLSEEERKNSIEPAYYEIDLKKSIKRSNYNAMLASNENMLGDSYDLRESSKNLNGIKIINKNQYTTGACWAFSFTSVLETSFAKQESKSIEYSPIHMEYTSAKMFNREFGNGGNGYLATAYCTSGKGPVLEESMPFENYYNTENYYLTPIDEITDPSAEIKAKINDVTFFPSINKGYENGSIKYYKDDGKTEYTAEEVKAIRNIIKQHIKEDGAISAVIYSDIKIDQNGTYHTSYYNQENSAYFCNNAETINHAITIVGWDDTYKTTNFKENCRPSSPGAYIILNSYGTDFGENGYMYVSYEDIFIESSLFGIDNLESSIDYDKIYQYDELGANLPLDFGKDVVYGGVKFIRDNKNEKIEYLNEIGIYLLDAEGIEIYLNGADDDFNNSELVYSSENALEAGYHCIKLPNPKKLTGEKFAIKVKYINAEGASLPTECNLKDTGLTIKSNYFDKAKSSQLRSFYSNDGVNWNDINGTKLELIYTLTNTDVCIKAFTSFVDASAEIPVTGIELNNSTVSVEEGSTVTLLETVKPSTATNKNVIWSSANKDVATVNGGVVTAKKKGTTTITVTTEDGGKTASCEVTVNEKKQEIIDVQSISLDKQEISLGVGKTGRLVEKIIPSTATNKNVTWNSTNEDVATVEGGVVTGKKQGTTTITVTTEDGGKTASCKINVTKEDVIVHVEKIELDKIQKTVQVGDTTNLIVSFTPSNASNKNIKWESSNTSVATITEAGVITAVKEGKTTIKAISEDGDKQATCELTVTKKTNTDDDIYKGDKTTKPDSSTDGTVANKKIPNAGIKITFVIIILGTISIVTIKFIKYRDLKDIK